MSKTKVTDTMREVTAVDAAKITTGTIPEARITSLDATKLTGTVANARIPAGAVTQHVTAFDPAQLEMNIAILAFKVASSNQLAKFSMVDQVIDEYQDATGIDAGNSTNESAGGATTAKYYEGVATGSEQTVVKSHTGANQTFVVPSGVTVLNFIAWGAGGGGGGSSNQIGGGGGFIEGNVSVTAGETLNVKVGGAGLISTVINGYQKSGGGGGTGIYRGSTVLAVAGAGGGAISAGAGQSDGGAGGGTTGGEAEVQSGTSAKGGTQSAGGSGPGSLGSNGAGTLNQGGSATDAASANGVGGYNGGGKGDGNDTNWNAGGGGGGYYGGSAGGESSSSRGPGAGGSSLTSGTNTQAVRGAGAVANAAHANYASGIGLGGTANGNGGHGRAVLKYTGLDAANLTLQSVATTAEVAPTTADLVVLIEDGSGTATVNTDVKGYVSRDGSAFSTAVTFVDEGDWGTNKRILVARNIDISGITTGTAMKYKLTTLNQSAGSKETRIHATSLAWA